MYIINICNSLDNVNLQLAYSRDSLMDNKNIAPEGAIFSNNYLC